MLTIGGIRGEGKTIMLLDYAQKHDLTILCKNIAHQTISENYAKSMGYDLRFVLFWDINPKTEVCIDDVRSLYDKRLYANVKLAVVNAEEMNKSDLIERLENYEANLKQ